jgi:predicted nucleic acid-binding protein
VGLEPDFPLGTTDAAVIALPERLGITEIATVDHRHFRAVRATPRSGVHAASLSHVQL